jgi:hypothetical protein
MSFARRNGITSRVRPYQNETAAVPINGAAHVRYSDLYLSRGEAKRGNARAELPLGVKFAGIGRACARVRCEFPRLFSVTE